MRGKWRDLAGVVKRFSGHRVVVLGDLVLDRYWYGEVQRMSREAPVPVVRIEETKLMPGCAANTVMNLRALGAEVVPVGVVGKDREGDALTGLFDQAGVDCSRIVRAKGWVTPTKTRVLAGSAHAPRQQLVRVDSGEGNLFTPGVADTVKRAIEKALGKAEALIISDYGYGLAKAAEAERYARKAALSALDSRFGIKSFHGLTTATPNEEEFGEASGADAKDGGKMLERAGEKLRGELGLQALLVTRGSRGMSLFEKGKKPLHIPIVGSDQAVDVTGAGDTVISAYVLALCCKASFAEAAHIANVAGGIVVERHGPATTNPKELCARIEAWGKGILK
jgi:rfaE bifunctional protein kinase chain/domain